MQSAPSATVATAGVTPLTLVPLSLGEKISASCSGSTRLTVLLLDEEREDCWQIEDADFIRDWPYRKSCPAIHSLSSIHLLSGLLRAGAPFLTSHFFLCFDSHVVFLAQAYSFSCALHSPVQGTRREVAWSFPACMCWGETSHLRSQCMFEDLHPGGAFPGTIQLS